MILLSFTVANHRSIRDVVTLDFVKPSLRTLQPRKGETWQEHVYPIAGIFGPNASGKTALLDALRYTISAISFSSTTWQAVKPMLRAPFKLWASSHPSFFELEFVFEDRRYMYGFEVVDAGISREWLKDVPSTRWRTLLERDGSSLKLHPTMKSVGTIAPRELVLSRALLLEHEALGPLAKHMTDSFDFLFVDDAHRIRRLTSIANSLADGTLRFSDIVTILQAADIGVDGVSIREDEVPASLRKLVRALNTQRFENENTDQSVDQAEPDELDDDEMDAVVRSLLFTHVGAVENSPTFTIDEESAGTITWLAIIVPALEILGSGGVICIDEIDASLHPHLLDVLLGLFDSSELNRYGAQLIFTSHDTYLLSPLSDISLEPEQIWFTDKTRTGKTQLASLAEFPRHKDANIARRYLLGRYGGTPRLAPTALASLLSRRDDGS